MTEGELAAQLTAAGFDFATPLAIIAQRVPPIANWGYDEQLVIPYHLPTDWAGLGHLWKLDYRPSWERLLPPASYRAELFPTNDARENFAHARAALRGVLGPGEKGEATNTLEERWQAGIFSVRVITWPREWNRQSTNVYEGRNPHLWTAANVYLEIPFGGIEERPPSPAKGERLVTQHRVSVCRGYYAVRTMAVPARNAAYWDGQTLKLLYEENEEHIPGAEITQVEHGVAARARGAGYEVISLHTRIAEQYSYSQTLVLGELGSGLKSTAKSLAKTLGKPMTENSWLDD
jgi:hypothetical protein